MYRVVIVDDEKESADLLESYLIDFFSGKINVVAKANSVKTGIAAINKKHPDIVLLDVELKPGNGFEILRQIKPIDFKVIFISAHEHYCIKAIKFSAMDFLIKPVNMEELRDTIYKAVKQLDRANIQYRKQHEVLDNNLKNGNKTLALSTTDSITFVNYADVCRIESQGQGVVVYLFNQEKITISKRISEYEKLLENITFYRTHKSHLINLAYVKKYMKGEGSILMTDGTVISLPRRKRMEFIIAMNRFISQQPINGQ